MTDASVTELLGRQGVRLGLSAGDRFEAVAQAGAVLLELGAIEEAYVDAMREREEMLSSYVGEGFALPHGTNESRAHVRRAALAFLQYPDGIDWEEDTVYACVAIASKTDEHVRVMQALAEVLLDEEQAERLRTTDDPDEVLDILVGGSD
jgi:mannitol/fructose-specific phosphotransferase system IIA component